MELFDDDDRRDSILYATIALNLAV
jgi:hypothetical protein